MENHTVDHEGTLLVAEDNDAMLSALKDILQSAGYRVLSATNGQKALDLFHHEKPDLILSDSSMPEMDGLQLLQSVRETTAGKTIPFILLTARDLRVDILNAKSLGADDYLVKPISGQELLTNIHSRLRRFEELRRCFTAAAN
jgi:DNA-binding response OmpR family regulator